jgi:hypothetical protein
MFASRIIIGFLSAEISDALCLAALGDIAVNEVGIDVVRKQGIKEHFG